MVVEGQITEHEFIRLNRWLFYHKPLIVVLHLAVFGVGLFWSTRTGFEDAKVWLSASPLLILLGLYAMVTGRARKMYRRNRTLQSPLRYVLSDEGLELSAPHGRAFLSWDRITGFRETSDHLLIYGSRGEAFVVAKHWFPEPEDAQEFLDTIAKHVGAREEEPAPEQEQGQ